ncbi:MAG TPA: OsmC family protein [Bacteroidota bacterium]|nr:OsmC family protein [Bacteroidota bacterium]
MDKYKAEILWLRNGQDFLDMRYSRKHTIRFDGGVEIAGSSSPHSVPLPMSDLSGVDPEEMFVSALSSCHMLWFLFIAAKQGYRVERYLDAAWGIMEKNDQGKAYMSVVTLTPAVTFSGDRIPTRAEIDQLHRAAHGECFIANSVKTDVRCEPVY